MSQENVELVREYYAGVNGGFSEGAFRRLLDPEIEIDMSRRMFDPEIYRGIDEVRRFRDELAASWGSYEVVPEEVLDAGDKLVAMVIVRAQGALSEAPVEVRVAHVMTFRHGKLLRLEYFGDREEALRAVGIEE